MSSVPHSARVKDAASLLKVILPYFIQVATHYASSSTIEAEKARESCKVHNKTRPFYVFLLRYLIQLMRASTTLLSTLPQLEGDRKFIRAPHSELSGSLGKISKSLAHVLDFFRDELIYLPKQQFGTTATYRSPNSTLGQDSHHWGVLLNWVSPANEQNNDRLISWLLDTTRLAHPSNRTWTSLLKALYACAQEIDGVLPVVPIPLDDDEIPSSSTEQIEVWRKVQAVCAGMGRLHKQMMGTWSCNCNPYHERLYFTIDFHRPLVNGFVPTSIIHRTKNWQQTLLYMKDAKKSGDCADYGNLCKDLQTSSKERF